MARYIQTLMGIAIFTLLALICAQVTSAQPFGIGSSQTSEAEMHKVLSSRHGRFVFGQISKSGKDQFMLDTLSGRLWRISESGKIGIYLKAVPYRTEKGEYLPLPGDVPVKKPQKAKKK
ncbi:hypothetical protein ACFL9T_12980 [Thermodesulfobacteriota bacterium]